MITQEGAVALAWLMFFASTPVYREAALREQAKERESEAA